MRNYTTSLIVAGLVAMPIGYGDNFRGAAFIGQNGQGQRPRQRAEALDQIAVPGTLAEVIEDDGDASGSAF